MCKSSLCAQIYYECESIGSNGRAQQPDLQLTYMYARTQEAAAQNERKRSAESAQAVLSRMQAARPGGGGAAGPPPPRVTELTPAEAAKEEGNAALKRGDVAQARRAAHRGRGVGALPRLMPTGHSVSDSPGHTKLKRMGLGMHLGDRDYGHRVPLVVQTACEAGMLLCFLSLTADDCRRARSPPVSLFSV